MFFDKNYNRIADNDEINVAILNEVYLCIATLENGLNTLRLTPKFDNEMQIADIDYCEDCSVLYHTELVQVKEDEFSECMLDTWNQVAPADGLMCDSW